MTETCLTEINMRVLTITLLALLALAAVAADWPAFRGPFATGIAPDTGINKDWNARKPAQQWRIPLTDGGFSGPSVAAGKVFIIDHQGNKDIVRALKLDTGAEVWRFEYQDAGGANYGFSQGTPVYSDGKLYTLSCEGRVHCLNAETGAKVWGISLTADLGGKAPGWRYAMSPLIDGDKIILCPGAGGGVVALNKNTGQPIWKSPVTDMPGYATPVVATIQKTPQYLIFAATTLNGVDAATGKLLWTFPWKTDCDVNAACPLTGGDFVYITSNYNRGCAFVQITPQGPNKVWENKNMHSHFSTPVVIDNLIYGTTDPGRLVCLDPTDSGKLRWQQNGFGKGGLVVVDGVLLVLDGNNGDLAMVKINPDKYEELGRFKPLGGQSWTAPIVAGGKLIVRNTKELACFDLK